MLFFARARFKKSLSKDVVEQNLKDIDTDTRGRIVYKGIGGRSGDTTRS